MKAKERLAIYLATKKKDYAEGLAIFKALAVNPDRNRFYDTPVPGNHQVNMLNNDLMRYARIHGIKPKSAKQVKKEQLQNDAAFQKLVKKTKQKPPKDAQPDKSIESIRVRVMKNPVVNYNELPEELKVVYDEFKNLYDSYDRNRAELVDLAEVEGKNDERKALAEAIIASKKTIRENWDKIDSWWKQQNGDGTGTEDAPAVASGKWTKSEIERMADPDIKAKSKLLRIEANKKYIARNAGSETEKVKAKLAERKKELDEWGVDYAELVAKNTASGSEISG